MSTITKQNAQRWITQAMTDYVAMLPLSAREPVAAMADQCIAVVVSEPAPQAVEG